MNPRVVIETDLECTVRDGTVLRADVYRPDDDAPHPVLVMRTPYGKHIHASTHLSLDPVRAAFKGYAVIIQDTRARFASDGEVFYPYRDEFADGYDTAQWAAQLPFCDGQVGAYGVSYMGGAAWHMAAAGPPSLKAISPTQTANDQFENVMWRGGAFMWGTHLVWSLASLAPLQLLRSRASDPGLAAAFEALVDAVDHFGSTAAHLPPSALPAADPERPLLPYFFDTMRHSARNEFHAQRSMTGRHRGVRVPALIIAGWHDVLLASDLEHYAAMRTQAATVEAREQTRLVIGPWTHAAFTSGAGELEFGMRAHGLAVDLKEDLTQLQLRWFDRWMKGRHTEEPRVRIFVEGEDRWRSVQEWPPPATRMVPWFLTPEGGLSPEPPSDGEPASYLYDPLDPCPTCGGSFLLPRPYAAGPVDQAPILNRTDVLAYTSAVLREPLLLVGPVRAVLYASTDGPDTDWVVKLCSVDPSGRTLNLCDGILRASFRARDWAQPSPLPAGALIRYEIDLWATAVRIDAGRRLRVLITSSDFPRYDRNPNTGTPGVKAVVTRVARQHVYTDGQRPSHVVLPVHP